MPIYEYHCSGCNRRVAIFFRSISEARSTSPVCPKCGSQVLERRMSRFRHIRGRSVGASDDLPFDESDLASLENEDPRAMARLFRRMSDETGEALEPEMEEVIDRLEKGEDPETIEESMEEKEGSSDSSVDDDVD